MLSVTFKSTFLSVIMLIIVMLNVVAPFKLLKLNDFVLILHQNKLQHFRLLKIFL